MNKNMVKRVLMIFCILIFGFLFVYSQNYADIDIVISNDGLVTIDGATNYEMFQNVVNSAKYTSKDQEYWIFNLTTQDDFEEYIFRLTLPDNAQINYVKMPSGFRIEEKDGRITIVGFAENKPFSLIVQYKIDYLNSVFSKDMIIILLSGLLVFMVVFSLVLLIKLNNIKNVKNVQILKKSVREKSYDIEMFTPRQQEIIKLLEERKRLTQKELEERMNIPKSSVSRNVRTLEVKGVIVKERVGQTNYLAMKNRE